MDGVIERDIKLRDAALLKIKEIALAAPARAPWAVLAGIPRVKGGTICGIASPYKTWRAIRIQAGCPDLRMHDLRHSFASAALAADLDLSAIGELLGHKSAQTTKGYAHLLEESGRAAVKSTADLIAERLAWKHKETTNGN